MITIRCFKQPDGTWWMDFPEYIQGGGNPEDLQLLRGVDTILEWAGNSMPDLVVQMDSIKFNEDCRPMYKADRVTDTGCYYFYAATDLISDHWGVWMSDVIKLFFSGKFPNTIFIKITENGNKTPGPVL